MEMTTCRTTIGTDARCVFPEPCHNQYWNTIMIHISFYCEQLGRSLPISELVKWMGENLKDLEDILYLEKQNILETRLFFY
jgi:hypothetical protein